MKSSAPEILQRLERILWAATLITIPVTSFRFMPFMGTDSQAKPLAFIPAALLLILLAFRSLRERRVLLWNPSLLPLLAFVLVALITSATGFFLAPADLYQYSYLNRLLRAWVTLGVGMVFLIVPIQMNRDEQDLKFSLKWLYVGFGAHVLWSGAQLFQFQVLEKYCTDQSIANLVDAIQKAVMMAGLSPNRRISGLTLEPSWLAAQIISLYLPWAFASLLTGYSWVKNRWLPALWFVLCAGLLLFTYSRSGILTAVGTVVLTILFTGGGWLRQGWRWFMQPFHVRAGRLRKRALDAGIRLALVLVILAGMVGGFQILSKNPYFAKIWQVRTSSLPSYFTQIYAGPRLAYASAGWTVFSQHPWTGVGLGALGLYFYQTLPDWSRFNISEVSQLLSSTNQIFPNAKDIYIRLLAETGMIGMWLFLSFYLLLLGKIMLLLRSKKKQLLFVGTASLLAWFGILAIGITQDSLAMVNIWLPMGVLIGMAESQLKKPLPITKK